VMKFIPLSLFLSIFIILLRICTCKLTISCEKEAGDVNSLAYM
jgi:hypothetical protein